jgi:hypothetical protein
VQIKLRQQGQECRASDAFPTSLDHRVSELSSDHSLSRTSLDPAADAAAMLLRLGFAIFALVVPSTSLLSRWVIVVLVPIGAVLIALSSMLRTDPLRAARAALARLVTLPGLLSLLLALWAMFSLAWSPAPGAAAGKLSKMIGILLVTQLAIEALPQRMRASNLHLVTIGVGMAAVMILLALVGDITGFWYLKVAALVPGRSALLLTCLGWSAGAWLLIKNRRPFAAMLGAMIFLIALLDPSREALAPAGVGLLVFALAWAMPERAGRFIAGLAGALVLLAPVLAGVFRMMGTGRISGWWDVARLDVLRTLTGRGFDAAAQARDKGLLDDRLPFSFVTDLWFDLGLLGAVGFAVLAFLAFRTAGRLGLEVAPLALAGLSGAFTYAFIERGATQTWWLNAMAVFAIVLASVERGRYRTVRPRAAISGASPLPAQGA